MDCEQPVGRKRIVWLLFSSNHPFLFLYAPSSFVPRDRSLIRIVESYSDSKSSLLSSIAGVFWNRVISIG